MSSYIIKNNDYFYLDNNVQDKINESSEILNNINIIDLISDSILNKNIVLSSMSLKIFTNNGYIYSYPSGYVGNRLNPEKFAILDYFVDMYKYTLFVKPYMSFYYSRSKIGIKSLHLNLIDDVTFQPDIIKEYINKYIHTDMPIFNLLKKLSFTKVSAKKIKEIDPNGNIFKFALYNYFNFIIKKDKNELIPLLNVQNNNLYILMKPNMFSNHIYSLSYYFIFYTHITNNKINSKEQSIISKIQSYKNDLNKLKRYVDVVNKSKRMKQYKSKYEEMNLFTLSHQVNPDYTYCCNIILPLTSPIEFV